ncbi:class I SAM-dependent methyltransferase [Aquimarina sp. RZ0]|uniref:class I SAM-dependent methyltransferase n=1 Tax=Aquimarina sp. RZ0 TaxID=2607730 RepID=UPI0021050C48|nr:class I SAM-dependent methyltransferase [Aquimarina sp. RZ0]
MDYENYYRSGKHDAEEIIKIVSRHETLDTTKILDWGCGPGRIIRHFPALLPTSEFYGTDYNKKTIDWCSANLPNINFNKNLLSPELPYQNDYFDLIYGISIFTHLSLEMHYGWFEELYRITKPGGILYITSQGDNFRHKLSVSELQDYENDTLVIRDNVKEGHRTFTTFHPPKFMRNLFERMEILEHIITKPPQGENWIPQDKWVLRKRIKNS